MTPEATAPGLVHRTRTLVGSLGAGLQRPEPTLLYYGLYTLVLFLVALAATFPHDLLLQRALRRATLGTRVTVASEGGTLGWSLAYGIDALRIRRSDGDGEALLQVEDVDLSPSLLGLLRGSPYPVGVGLSLYGGTLRATIDPRPASFRVAATLADVDLARYTGLRPMVEGAIRGRLQGTLDVDGAGRGPAAAGGTVALSLPGLVLEGVKVNGITVPDLRFGDVHLAGALKNGRLEIGELVALGDELTVRGDGSVLVRTPLPASVLGLDLVVTPTERASDGLRMMVSMLPGSKADGGARRIAVGGTLGRPTVR